MAVLLLVLELTWIGTDPRIAAFCLVDVHFFTFFISRLELMHRKHMK